MLIQDLVTGVASFQINVRVNNYVRTPNSIILDVVTSCHWISMILVYCYKYDLIWEGQLSVRFVMHTMYGFDSSRHSSLSANQQLCSVTTRDLQKARRSASRGIICKARVVKNHAKAIRSREPRLHGRMTNATAMVRPCPYIDIADRTL